MGMMQVVAAVIEREGRILIGRRTAAQSHPLKWEFPGGKVEPGETPPQALARELEEELDIRSAAGEEITRYEYTYPGKNPIVLVFFRVTGFSGEPHNRIFEELRWEVPEKLAGLDFVEGDTCFIRGLSDGIYTGSYGISNQVDRSRPE
jgi:8-oxo-dGTP diphosphatase